MTTHITHIRRLAALACLAGAVTTATAQLHDGDIILRLLDNTITTATTELEPRCTFTGEFGTGDQTPDPGFDSEVDEFPPNSEIGFTLLRSLREWRDGNFDTIPEEQFEMSWGPLGPIATTLDDTPAVGFTLGVSGDGEFHYHYKFKLTPPADPGIYLLTFAMWSDQQGINPSEPIYLLFNQDTDQPTFVDAVTWWETNGAWCSADACVADFNGDGVVNTQDFLAYLNAWTAGDPAADINGDGVVNTQDFLAFLNLWTAGC